MCRVDRFLVLERSLCCSTGLLLQGYVRQGCRSWEITMLQLGSFARLSFRPSGVAGSVYLIVR